jgi:hypothetical protein
VSFRYCKRLNSTSQDFKHQKLNLLIFLSLKKNIKGYKIKNK